MSVKELGHIVLYVSDIDRSVAFYRDVIGFNMVLGGESGMSVAMFSSGRTHHELLLIQVGNGAKPIPSGRRVGMYHFGLKVGDTDDELRAVLAHIQAAGVQLAGASDHTVTHSLYLFDPDGNELELYVDVPGVDWNDLASLGAPTKALRL